MGSQLNQDSMAVFISSCVPDFAQFHRILSRYNYTVIVFDGESHALEQLKNGLLPRLIFVDIRIGDLRGLETMRSIRELGYSLPIVAITTVEQARAKKLAMPHGADAFLIHPFNDADLDFVLADVQKRYPDSMLSMENAKGRPDFISVSKKMLQIKDILQQVASADVPVLIQGESGVGKEVLTNYLHNQSERHNAPFVKLNCAALSTELIEAELFGHEKGSFTGAVSNKLGKFEIADGGTLLLDEITEITLPIQAKMLHVLQDGCFFKVGGSKYITTDVRVVATTNRVLKDAVHAGHFREDLYFRLAVIEISVPPLRERKEDIPVLCTHFLKKYETKYKHAPRELPLWISDLFQAYDWPGNVRELENIVRRLLVLQDEHLVLRDIAMAVEKKSKASEYASPPGSSADMSLKTIQTQSRLSRSNAEREVVLRALEVNQWNRKKTALQLGISYKTLLNNLGKWGIKQ